MPGKMVEPRAQEPNVLGNHDNPVSCNHQGTVTLKNSGIMILTYTYQRGREGGYGAKSPSTVEMAKVQLRMS